MGPSVGQLLPADATVTSMLASGLFDMVKAYTPASRKVKANSVTLPYAR